MISQKIESATSDLLIESDQTLNLEICDTVNSNPTLCPDVIKLLKARLKHKDNRIAILAISLLEALIKNCPVIHQYIANEKFMNTLVKLTRPEKKKKNPISFIKRLNQNYDETSIYEESEKVEKILILIQSLGTSFANSTSFPIFRRIYQNLLHQGVRFPTLLKDEGAPIFTPPVKHSAPPQQQQPQLNQTTTSTSNYNEASKIRVRPALSCPQTYEYRSDLSFKSTHENAVLLFEMLDNFDMKSDLKTDEVINTLVHGCQIKRGEIIKKLGSEMTEMATSEALSLNDILTQVITYYDNLVSGTVSQPSSQKLILNTEVSSPETIVDSVPPYSSEYLSSNNIAESSQQNKNNSTIDTSFLNTGSAPLPLQASNKYGAQHSTGDLLGLSSHGIVPSNSTSTQQNSVTSKLEASFEQKLNINDEVKEVKAGERKQNTSSQIQLLSNKPTISQEKSDDFDQFFVEIASRNNNSNSENSSNTAQNDEDLCFDQICTAKQNKTDILPNHFTLSNSNNSNNTDNNPFAENDNAQNNNTQKSNTETSNSTVTSGINPFDPLYQ